MGESSGGGISNLQQDDGAPMMLVKAMLETLKVVLFKKKQPKQNYWNRSIKKSWNKFLIVLINTFVEGLNTNTDIVEDDEEEEVDTSTKEEEEEESQEEP